MKNEFGGERKAVSTRTLPLRVLFVATSTGQGGLEQHSVETARWLEQEGISVTYACRPDGFLERLCAAKQVTTHPLVVRNSGDLLAAFRLAGCILRGKFSIVHVHSRRDFVVSVLAVALARACIWRPQERPSLVLHAHLLREFGTPAGLSGRFFERGADAVVTVSEVARDFLLRVHQFDGRFVKTIYNGIDADAYQFAPPQRRRLRNRYRQQWGCSDTAPVVGMVGRLNAKGQAALLRAAPRVLACVPDARFIFVGPKREPGDDWLLEYLAQVMGVGHACVFTGPLENIPEVLTTFDALVHLPTEESFGLALAEALAAGIPVIAAQTGGCAEIVTHGITGMLVPPQDEDCLVEALCKMLTEGGAATRRRMALAGPRHARSRFSRAQQSEGLQALYAQLQDAKAKAPAAAGVPAKAV